MPVVILLSNYPEFVLSFLAASFRGATVTAANPFFTPAEIVKQAVEISSDDVVALLYSFDTTDLPEGVMLTHKRLVTSVAQQLEDMQQQLENLLDDVVATCRPMTRGEKREQVIAVDCCTGDKKWKTSRRV
ncbi:hypothetical protein Bca4012_023833 [Brassica carinata]